MPLEQLTEWFKWMTIINVAIFTISAVLSMALKKTVSRMHGRLFGVSEDTVSTVVYTYFGIYKIAIAVFSLVPYLSLLLIRQ